MCRRSSRSCGGSERHEPNTIWNLHLVTQQEAVFLSIEWEEVAALVLGGGWFAVESLRVD